MHHPGACGPDPSPAVLAFRTLPQPKSVSPPRPSDTPSMHHNSLAGSDFSDSQKPRLSVWSAVQPPMAACHQGRISRTEARYAEMLKGRHSLSGRDWKAKQLLRLSSFRLLSSPVPARPMQNQRTSPCHFEARSAFYADARTGDRSKVRLTFGEGLQRLASKQLERLERCAATDGWPGSHRVKQRSD